MKASSLLKFFACGKSPIHTCNSLVAEEESVSIENSVYNSFPPPIQEIDERPGHNMMQLSGVLDDIEEEVNIEQNKACSSHKIPVPSPCQSIRSRLSRTMLSQQTGPTLERSATEPIISFSLLGIQNSPAKKGRLGQSKTFIKPVSPAPPVRPNTAPTMEMRQIAAAKIRAVAVMYAERAQASIDRAAQSLRQAELEIERRRASERMTALGASKILQMARSNALRKYGISRQFDPRRISEPNAHKTESADQESRFGSGSGRGYKYW